MVPKLRALIQQGLTKQNLDELIVDCEQLVDQKPAIYHTLSSIFRSLAQEYDAHDAVPMSRYDLVNSTLRRPLLELLDAEGQSAGTILRCLDNLIHAFRGL